MPEAKHSEKHSPRLKSLTKPGNVQRTILILAVVIITRGMAVHDQLHGKIKLRMELGNLSRFIEVRDQIHPKRQVENHKIHISHNVIN